MEEAEPKVETYMDRLLVERDELKIKHDKLRNAILDEEVPKDQVPILTKQWDAMHSYLNILDERIG